MLHQAEDPLQSKIYRASMNAFHRADILTRKSSRNARLAIKKLQLHQVKKSFGIEYMTLLEKNASLDELDRCLREGHDKIGVINKDIRTLVGEKTSLDELLQRKLVRKIDGADTHESDGSSQESSTPPPPTNPEVSPSPHEAPEEDSQNDDSRDIGVRDEPSTTATTNEQEEGGEEEEIDASPLPPVAEPSQEDTFVVLPLLPRTESGSE